MTALQFFMIMAAMGFCSSMIIKAVGALTEEVKGARYQLQKMDERLQDIAATARLSAPPERKGERLFD